MNPFLPNCDRTMQGAQIRCLILACGNSLRGDDGAGPWLATWAENCFRAEPAVRVLARQQWTPELAEEIAHAESVLFVDCAVNVHPGKLQLVAVTPPANAPALSAHHLGPAELLDLSRSLYDSLPRSALLLTIGAGSLELSEQFSDAVQAALPAACRLVEEAVGRLLAGAAPADPPHCA